MLYGLAYLLTMLCVNADERTALTRTFSVSVRWQLGQSQMKLGKKRNNAIILRLQHKEVQITNNHKIEGCNGFI